MTKNANANDWGRRIVDGAKAVIKAQDAGEAAIARFVRDDIMPYIGMRMQEGALVWRADSEDACNDVARDICEAGEVASVKGVPKGSDKYRSIMAMQMRIKRAVQFYRAITLLSERSGFGARWDKLLFPVAWVYDDGAEDALPLFHNDSIARHDHYLPIRKDAQGVPLLSESGGMATGSVQMTVNALLRASGVVKAPQREPEQPQGAAAPAETAGTALQAAEGLGSFLAKANGEPITGPMADALEPIIQQIVANETLWALALAERDAWQKMREDAAKAA